MQGIGIGCVLRMPLDSDDPARTRGFDCFDDTIVTATRDHEVVSEIIDGLMVEGETCFRSNRAHRSRHSRFRRERYRMGPLSVSGKRKVLDQCSSTHHIENLGSATDCQHWLGSSENFLHDRAFHSIMGSIHTVDVLCRGHLAVQRRVDISTTVKNDTITSSNDRADVVDHVDQRRKNQGDATGANDGALIPVSGSEARCAQACRLGEFATDDQDQRSSHLESLAGRNPWGKYPVLQSTGNWGWSHDTDNAGDMVSLFDSVSFAHGPAMSNRFMLAPLTNQQSHVDGTLSDDEHHWLTMRAIGGFGLTMTCAASVNAHGLGFSGQLGCHRDDHIDGLRRLATDITARGSVAIVQLHHAGMRSPADLIGGAPLCPSEDAATGARSMTSTEIDETIEDFISAAERCEAAGFDGVELHGAHGYLLCQFLSSEVNHRTDEYGGSLENRARMLMTILRGIRQRCRQDFNVSVRLSPERFGLKTSEIVTVYGWLVESGWVDFIDMSMWDVRKQAADEDCAGRTLMDIFSGLDRGSTRLAVAGKIYSAQDAQWTIDRGADMAVIGRGAILHHDFPNLVRSDPNFEVRSLPVDPNVLRAEGLSDAFVGYMRNWPGFVADS